MKKLLFAAYSLDIGGIEKALVRNHFLFLSSLSLENQEKQS